MYGLINSKVMFVNVDDDTAIEHVATTPTILLVTKAYSERILEN